MRSLADAHLHVYKYDYAVTSAFLDDLARENVKEAALQSLAAHMNFGVAQNLYTLYTKCNYKKIDLYAFGSLQELEPYTDVPYEKQVERLLSVGCDGMKFIQMKPNVRKHLGRGICDPAYDAAFSILEETRTPVLIHSADPETFWDITKMEPDHVKLGWYYGDGTFPTSEQIYTETFARLDRNPRLNVILAHFFFLSFKPDEAVRVLERYPNVFFDLTPGWEMYDGFAANVDFWHDFFEKYSDRIIFGTDDHDNRAAYRHKNIGRSVCTILEHERGAFELSTFEGRRVAGLGLSDGTLDKICRENFLRYVGKSPATVTPDVIASLAERMLWDIRDVAAEEKSAVWLRNILNS